MPFPHGHALIIGVGTYQHEPRLNVPTTTSNPDHRPRSSASVMVAYKRWVQPTFSREAASA
jgi:hypothetical protein